MNEVFIVDAQRTPIGKFRGALAQVRADEMLAELLKHLVLRSRLEGNNIDDFVAGCVTQVGEQCGNIARTALLSAGLPYQIPGMTVDRKCGSGEAAVHVAASSISCGAAQLVFAGGAESMTRVPMGCNRDNHGDVFGPELLERYELCSQGEAAERLSDHWGLSRNDLDQFAMESHNRAIAASRAGYFAREIMPLSTKASALGAESLSADETIRFDTSAERLSGLKAVFREPGRVTAGNSSQICDGAAVLLLAAGSALKRYSLVPRARIVATAVVGSDPEMMLTGPIVATRQVLANASLSADDIDLFEVNEAFASVPLVWMKESGVSHDRLNVNGGAIALGHPLGATGARIMTTMLHNLERNELRYGLQSICCAGGMATATIIERLH